MAARGEGGPFSSIYNFCERVNIGECEPARDGEPDQGGRLDSLGGNRAQLSEALDRAIETGMRASRDRAMGQHGLFGVFDDEEKYEYPLANLPDWTMEQKLAGEKEVLGIYVSGHPLDRSRTRSPIWPRTSRISWRTWKKDVSVELCADC